MRTSRSMLRAVARSVSVRTPFIETTGLFICGLTFSWQDGRPYCVSRTSLPFANCFRRSDFHENGRFSRQLSVYTRVGPINSPFRSLNWSHPDSELQLQSERSLHLIELGKLIEV